MATDMSSSACTLLPSLDRKGWVTLSSVMTGEGRSTLPDGDLEATEDRAAALGSTGIKTMRFPHAAVGQSSWGNSKVPAVGGAGQKSHLQVRHSSDRQQP